MRLYVQLTEVELKAGRLDKTKSCAEQVMEVRWPLPDTAVELTVMLVPGGTQIVQAFHYFFPESNTVVDSVHE